MTSPETSDHSTVSSDGDFLANDPLYTDIHMMPVLVGIAEAEDVMVECAFTTFLQNVQRGRRHINVMDTTLILLIYIVLVEDSDVLA